MKSLLRALLLAAGAILSGNAGAVSLGDVITATTLAQAGQTRSARAPACTPISQSVPGTVSGSATLSYFPCEVAYGQDGTISTAYTITFNDFSVVAGVSSNGSIRVDACVSYVQSGNLISMSYDYSLNSPGGQPTTYSLKGQGYSVVFENFSLHMSSTTNTATHHVEVSGAAFSGGVSVNGRFYAANEELFHYIW